MTVYLVDGQDIITYIILYHVTATNGELQVLKAENTIRAISFHLELQ